MIKTIYFDLGNVIVFFSLPKMFAQLSQCTGVAPSTIEQMYYRTGLQKLYETGKIDTDYLYQLFSKQTPKPFSFHEFTTAFSDIFTPNQELWPVIEQLKQNGIDLILLSNTSECHFKYIHSHYPILQAFDHKILSYEVGTWKPEPQIFQKALALAKSAPEECFYIDDIPEYTQAARKEGLPGETFTDVASLKKQLMQRGLPIQ